MITLVHSYTGANAGVPVREASSVHDAVQRNGTRWLIGFSLLQGRNDPFGQGKVEHFPTRDDLLALHKPFL